MRRSSNFAMRGYSLKPWTKEYVKWYGALSFARIYIVEQLLNTGLDGLKTASKKLVHKADEFLENKIEDAVTKSDGDKVGRPNENPRNF